MPLLMIRRAIRNLAAAGAIPLPFLIHVGLSAGVPRFEAREIDPRVGEVCYAVATADVDGDGRPDVVAVSENRVVWYRNPDWEPWTIIADAVERDHVCLAPHDVDGDGKIDFALGAGWLNNRHLGTIYWLTRGDSLIEPWRVRPIGRESWTHRVRWGDLLGTGRPQLIVSPLNKTEGAGVRVLAYEVPGSPQTDAWKRTVLDEELNAMHNHWLGDLDRDGRTDLITASLEGVFLFQRDETGKLAKRQIGAGAPGPREPQKSGAGEIRVGRIKGRGPFVATVEPMHGNQVAVYVPSEPRPSAATTWTRHVLDDTLRRGHAVAAADLDGDGTDEIVIGHSDPGTGDPAGPGIFVYELSDAETFRWKKHAIDQGGIATEDLVVDDLNGDRFPDIVAGGRATHNVKVYINRRSGTP